MSVAHRRTLTIPNQTTLPNDAANTDVAHPHAVSIVEELALAPASVAETWFNARVVLLGRFQMSRRDLRARLETHGARVTTSLSGKTTCLVLGAHGLGKTGHAKIEHARARGIQIIDERELLQALGRIVPTPQRTLLTKDNEDNTLNTPIPTHAPCNVSEQLDKLKTPFEKLRFAARLPQAVELPVQRTLTRLFGRWRQVCAIFDAADRGAWTESDVLLRDASKTVCKTLYMICLDDSPLNLSAASRWRLGVRCIRILKPSNWRAWLLRRMLWPGEQIDNALASSLTIDAAFMGPTRAFSLQQREFGRGLDSADAVAEGRAAYVYTLEDNDGEPTLDDISACFDALVEAGIFCHYDSDVMTGKERFELGHIPVMPIL